MLPKDVRRYIRFRQAVEGQTAHWIWVGPHRANGLYGTIGDHNAHRWIYRRMRYLNDDDRLKSVCKTKMCVNPNHWRRVRTKQAA